MKKTILVILIALTFISFVIAGTILSDRTISVSTADMVILEKMKLVNYTYEDNILKNMTIRCVYSTIGENYKILRFCVHTSNRGKTTDKIISELDNAEQMKLAYLISDYKRKQEIILNQSLIEPARTGRTIVQEK